MTQRVTILFLDDCKSPEWYGLKAEEIQVCRTGEEALRWGAKRPIDVLYLDHDLGDGISGYTVLEELIDQYNNPPKAVVIISLNPVGTQRITALCQYNDIPVIKRLPPNEILIGGQSG